MSLTAIQSKFDRTIAKTSRARELRQKTTDAERKLWQHLRAHQFCGLAFRRQHPIGRFFLDFYCASLKLAIEIDGGQHGLEPHAAADAARDAWLSKRGVTVFRFWNNEVVSNLEGVLTVIRSEVQRLRPQCRIPTPTLPFARGGSEVITSPREGEGVAERRVGIDLIEAQT